MHKPPPNGWHELEDDGLPVEIIVAELEARGAGLQRPRW